MGGGGALYYPCPQPTAAMIGLQVALAGGAGAGTVGRWILVRNSAGFATPKLIITATVKTYDRRGFTLFLTYLTFVISCQLHFQARMYFAPQINRFSCDMMNDDEKIVSPRELMHLTQIHLRYLFILAGTARCLRQHQINLSSSTYPARGAICICAAG